MIQQADRHGPLLCDGGWPMPGRCCTEPVLESGLSDTCFCVYVTRCLVEKSHSMRAWYIPIVVPGPQGETTCMSTPAHARPQTRGMVASGCECEAAGGLRVVWSACASSLAKDFAWAAWLLAVYPFTLGPRAPPPAAAAAPQRAWAWRQPACACRDLARSSGDRGGRSTWQVAPTYWLIRKS